MSNPSHYGGLDKQIAHLMQCKPLTEQEIKELCEKVSNFCFQDFHYAIKRSFDLLSFITLCLKTKSDL